MGLTFTTLRLIINIVIAIIFTITAAGAAVVEGALVISWFFPVLRCRVPGYDRSPSRFGVREFGDQVVDLKNYIFGRHKKFPIESRLYGNLAASLRSYPASFANSDPAVSPLRRPPTAAAVQCGLMGKDALMGRVREGWAPRLLASRRRATHTDGD